MMLNFMRLVCFSLYVISFLGHYLVYIFLPSAVFLFVHYYNSSSQCFLQQYQEIKFEPNVMCEYIDTRLLFRSCQVMLSAMLLNLISYLFLRCWLTMILLYSQLEDGDIICFQKSPKPDSADQYRYPDVPSFLVYTRHRQVPSSTPLTRILNSMLFDFGTPFYEGVSMLIWLN
jgi:hypothetical protein